MKTLSLAFMFLLLLSACGRTTMNFRYQETPFNGDLSTAASRSIVSMDQNSTVPFTPVSVDAKYGDCSGAILYNVKIRGNNGASILVSSQTMPILNYQYTTTGGTLTPPGSQPNISPNIDLGGSNGINFANPGTFTKITFTKATDNRVAFNFRVSFGPGLELGGTVDVPLTPGRQIVCR